MARISHGTFAGPAGRLEYILNEDAGWGPSEPQRAAVVCHPHPLHGGTMHTKIVYHAAQTLARRGFAVLRFHFRGVGASQGVHDHGEGEQQDLAAAIAFSRSRYPVPVTVAGFSFGAATVVRLLAAHAYPEVERAVLLGLPVDHGELPTVWAWQGPKLMISGDHDRFGAVERLEAYYQRLAEPKARVWVAGGDHFLSGRMEEFRELLGGMVDSGVVAGG